MAFNPDEFLAETPPASPTSSGFDPDTFLAGSQDPQAQADAAQKREEDLQASAGSFKDQAAIFGKHAARTSTFGVSTVLEDHSKSKMQEEANPISAVAGDVVGLLSPVGLEGKILQKVGAKAAEKIVGEGVLNGVARGAVKLGAENALYQGGDEVSKMIQQDPNQSLQTALTNVGLAGLIGGAAGGALGTVSPLWKATVGDKAGNLVNDFKARMREHLELPPAEPEPLEHIQPSAPREGFDPFTKEPITLPAESSIPGGPKSTMDPFTHEEYTPQSKVPGEPKAAGSREGYDPFTKAHITLPADSAIPEGPRSTFDPFTHEPYTPESKAPQVPSITLADEKALAPTKLTPGQKLADLVVKHGASLSGEGLGASVGGALGHMTGIPGGGLVGSMVGERALSPFFKSVLPGIIRPLIERATSAEGAKAAVDYGLAVAKGMQTTNNAVKSVFKAGSQLVLPERSLPDDKSRAKLDARLQAFKSNPEHITNLGGAVSHYLPDHAVAIGGLTTRITNFLGSLKPVVNPQTPLDKPKPVSKLVQSQYNRALDIANQPLVVLKSLKEGTITSHDVMALQIMYPELYQGLKQTAMSQMIDHVSKDGEIPYSTRLGLSVFLGQPLDSTMLPNSIASAQPPPSMPPNDPNQPQGKSLAAAKGNALTKGSKSFQTASQASEGMHSSGAKA